MFCWLGKAAFGRRHGHVCVAMLFATVFVASACKPDEPAPAAAASSSTAASAATASNGMPPTVEPLSPIGQSPIEVVRALHEARWSGKHSAMQEHLVISQRNAVLDLVRAVDQLIAAENVLQDAVRKTVGEGSALRFHQRMQVANIIGPLSRDVEVVSELVEGTRAQVTFQVAGRVPLEQVKLVQEGGRWRVRTDEPIPGLADALRDLAGVTRRFAGEIPRGQLDAAKIERELALRQAPIMRRIARMTNDE